VQVRNIILLSASAAVLVAMVALVFAARGTRATEVDQQELAKAMARHKQMQPKVAPSAPTPRMSKPTTGGIARAPRPAATEPAPPDESPAVAPIAAAPAAAAPEATPAETLKSQMDAANKLYDKAEYEGAMEAALEILETNPKIVRMLRIVVSASCIMGEEERAKKYYEDLPPRDQRQMARRCKRYGVEFD
jgi:hypothetical protein